jgi:hypothetical protein
MRDCNEYNRHTLTIPEGVTQEKFEEDYRESDDCFCEGDVYETVAYFGFREHVEVSLDDKVVFESDDMRKVFKSEDGNNCCYVPDAPEVGKANLWWYHDMKFNEVYVWENVDEFDPSKVTIYVGKDQNDKPYLSSIEYNNETWSDMLDYGDTGYGYSDLEFVYNEDQKFPEEEDEEND